MTDAPRRDGDNDREDRPRQRRSPRSGPASGDDRRSGGFRDGRGRGPGARRGVGGAQGRAGFGGRRDDRRQRQQGESGESELSDRNSRRYSSRGERADREARFARDGGEARRPNRGEGRSFGRHERRGGRAHSKEGFDEYPGLSREEVREITRAQRPGLGRRADEPPTPEGLDEKMMPRAMRAELRSLPKDLALIVGAHLVAAGELIDEDPELALAHAHAARRRAARLPLVREATAEAAYAAGDYATALSEYRALQRMAGSPDFLPVMADCERALGRPREALKLAAQAATQQLDPAMRIEMTIVEAGARADLGQVDEALRLLQGALSARKGPREGHARLAYTAADLLERQGRRQDAITLFTRSLQLDDDEMLDAAVRLARLGAPGSPESEIDVLAMLDDEEQPEGDESPSSDEDGDVLPEGGLTSHGEQLELESREER